MANPKEQDLFKIFTVKQIRDILSMPMPKEEAWLALESQIDLFTAKTRVWLDSLSKPISSIQDVTDITNCIDAEDVPIPIETGNKKSIPTIVMDLKCVVAGEARKGKKYGLTSPEPIGEVIKTDLTVWIEAQVSKSQIEVLKDKPANQLQAIRDFSLHVQTRYKKQAHDGQDPNTFDNIIEDIHNQTKKAVTKLIKELKTLLSE